ncbi:MAG: hypothetical protein U5N86_04480 [Planctomycetota bacterium]|nr:hypothetical protein [Planctomycetota bacterium]
MRYVLFGVVAFIGLVVFVMLVAGGFLMFFGTAPEPTKSLAATTDDSERNIRDAVERKNNEQVSLAKRLNGENVTTSILENFSLELMSAEPLTQGRITLTLRISNSGEREAIVSSLQHSCKVYVGGATYDIRSEERKLSTISAGGKTDVLLIVNTDAEGETVLFVEWFNVNDRTQQEESLRSNEVRITL